MRSSSPSGVMCRGMGLVAAAEGPGRGGPWVLEAPGSRQQAPAAIPAAAALSPERGRAVSEAEAVEQGCASNLGAQLLVGAGVHVSVAGRSPGCCWRRTAGLTVRRGCLAPGWGPTGPCLPAHQEGEAEQQLGQFRVAVQLRGGRKGTTAIHVAQCQQWGMGTVTLAVDRSSMRVQRAFLGRLSLAHPVLYIHAQTRPWVACVAGKGW